MTRHFWHRHLRQNVLSRVRNQSKARRTERLKTGLPTCTSEEKKVSIKCHEKPLRPTSVCASVCAYGESGVKEQLQARTQGTLNFAHIRSGAQGVDCSRHSGPAPAHLSIFIVYTLVFRQSPPLSLCCCTIIALI